MWRRHDRLKQLTTFLVGLEIGEDISIIFPYLFYAKVNLTKLDAIRTRLVDFTICYTNNTSIQNLANSNFLYIETTPNEQIMCDQLKLK